ncbi:MAG TPA: ATP-binding cassette domain-containing protein [Anaerolineales bacterium]|nr:ATP-binding cassette domain-containing protein [Anaerolineae bacterium]HIQ00546.1 ATP-binding cassette domain-containing protein [Anaerolineales bacterium]
MKVELIDIHKYFGPVRANEGISLTLEPGTIHGLLGENGAGKTTLMKCLSGYLSPDSGSVWLDGQPVFFSSPAEAIRHGIGMLHQDPLDFPQMRVLDNFLLAFDRRMLPDRRRGRVMLRELGDRFRFDLDPDAPVTSLTIGERQQLEILRLLALGARLIILDEPTTGISAPQKEQLFETLRFLAEEEGRSVVFVSHKLEEVEELCHRVTVLRQGKVAGEAEMPCPVDRLVEMMFGRSLPPARRVPVEPGSAVLQVRDVTVSSYRLTVEGASLTVRAGEVVGLAGLEGSGQRLFLRACAGLERTAAGRIWMGGRNLTGAPYRRFLEAGVAYMPAGRLEEGLVGGLTLTEHFALAERNGPFFINWAAARDQAAERIRHFNIVGRPESPVEALSGGNQQRVMLALLPPGLRLLLMEHPTRGLDVESANWVWQQLLARRAEGTAIVFISADLDELLERSNRVVVFFGGRMMEPLEACETTVEQLGYLIAGKDAS